MTPHRAKGEKVYRIYVPTRHGGVKIRTTGTRHLPTAKAMQRMVEALGPKGTRDWQLLGAVADRTLSLGKLYDAYRMNDLATLRAQLSDVDLSTYLDAWKAWLVDRVTPATIEHYTTHLASLHKDQPWFRSTLTPQRVSNWLGALKVQGATKRKYYAALASFLGYLESIGVATGEPLRNVSPPPAPAPKITFLELADVRRVIDASPEGYRGLFALLYGTAIDLSTALALKVRDVSRETHEIHARGTKHHTRNRICLVAEWAWPMVDGLLADKLPGALLFPGISRWTASDVHREAVTALELGPMPLRNARHHYAVRAIRAGTPIELVARQLGHVDGTLALRVYGRYVPRTEERQKWEREASKAEGAR